jgi:hypothetical protein
LILLMLFYGWFYDRASRINGKSGAELPSTYEGSCPPLRGYPEIWFGKEVDFLDS